MSIGRKKTLFTLALIAFPTAIGDLNSTKAKANFSSAMNMVGQSRNT